MSEKTSWACRRAKYGERASLKNFYKLIHTVHILLFTLKINPKKLCLSGGYGNVSR